MQSSQGSRSTSVSDIVGLLTSAILMVSVLPALAPAQIDVNEPGLNSSQAVYGLNATTALPPCINAEVITLWALGETDPLAYVNASFRAYGLYCDVDLLNTGAVQTNAVGGSATSDSSAYAGIHAFGVYAYDGNDVNNVGDIVVSVLGGQADANDGDADAYIEAYGLYTVDANEWPSTYGIVELTSASSARQTINSGAINVTVTAGTADANDGDAQAQASVSGIKAYSGDVTNTGDVSVSASGGDAISNDGDARAQSQAYGLQARAGSADNSGAISVVSEGGDADTNNGDATADAYGYGVYAGDSVLNGGDVSVDVAGGTALVDADTSPSTAQAYACADGIIADADVNNAGALLLTATGGTADANSAYANGSALGIEARSIFNSGTIDLSATGGTAYGSETANAAAFGTGLRSFEDASNAGDIVVNAIGGRAMPEDCDYGAASARAIGIDGYGDVNSVGTIGVSALGGTVGQYAIDQWPTPYGRVSGGTITEADAYAVAYGIDTETDVNNVGAMAVAALGGSAIAAEQASGYAEAYGVYANGQIRNAGAAGVTAFGGTAEASQGNANSTATAYDFYSVNGGVDNSGALSGVSIGGSADANDGSAQAYAMGYGVYAFWGDVNNDGDTTVTSSGGSAVVTGAAGGPASADANVYGLTSSHGSATNTGNLTVSAMAGTAQTTHGNAQATALAYGIYPGDSLNNSGDVAVVVIGGTADANDGNADASAFGSGLIAVNDPMTNSGDITVTAVGGTADASNGDADADATAHGLYMLGGDVVNTGNVTVAAVGGVAQGDATRTLGQAYGIYILGDSALTNTGIIQASGNTAYEVYVAGGTVTLVDTYNVTLDGDPNDASLRVGGTLALNDAALTVTSIFGETLWNTEYQLFETDPNAAVTGQFGDVQAVNPDTTVTYYTQGTDNAADDTVALTYEPTASETSGSAAVEKQLVWQSKDVVHQRMTSTLLNSVLYSSGSGLLVDAGPTGKGLGLAKSAPGQDKAGVFFEPYYSQMDQDADPLGYDAHLWGFAAGYERQLDDTLIGLHAGYGQADVDFAGAGYSHNSEDQDILTAGVTGLTRRDDWTLRYGVTGFYGWHDYRGVTGVALTETETASMNSYGVVASLMAGHIFRHGPHVLLPEVGVNYLWGHRERYTTEASNPAFDTTFSAMDDHDVEAEASLHWLTGFMHNDTHVTPALSVGVRHLLTDDESTVSMAIPNTAPVSVKSERDRTAMTFSGSVTLTKSNHAVSAVYDGEYSKDTARHSFWLRYGWQF